MSGDRVYELIGARIVGIEVDGEEAYLEVEHRGTDDDAAVLTIRVAEIEWSREQG